MGLVFGVVTRFMLKLMHRRGHKAPEQLALTVAMAYLCFYVANAPSESQPLAACTLQPTGTAVLYMYCTCAPSNLSSHCCVSMSKGGVAGPAIVICMCL